MGIMIKKLNSVILWLKCSNFWPIVNQLQFSSLWRTNQWNKDSIFVEFNLFIILVRVKCILPHCTKFELKQLIRHKFLKGDFSKSNEKWSTDWQKVGTETQSAIWIRFFPNRPKISSLDCCRQRQFYLE